MIDTNSKRKYISENIIQTACNTNPMFKRAYENYQSDNYDIAILDLDDCINKNANVDAALVIRTFCYLNTGNYPSACQDMLKLKTTNGMDSKVQELYYKYCTGPNAENGFQQYRLNH